MDRLTKEQRHKNMMANKSRGTRIELLLGHMMWNAGLRYRKNDPSLPGTPDFTIRGQKIAIFCDGEFWHGRNWDENKERIKTNRKFWYAKIERNQKRDADVTRQLSEMGWKVFRFWESDIRHEPERCLNEIISYIHGVKNSMHPPVQTYGSACSTMNIYGPHSYNRDGSIMSVSDQMAVVSHYLHNYGSRSAEPFEDMGEGLIEDIREDSCDCTSVSEEDVRQQLMGSTFSAPFSQPLHTRFTFADLYAGIGGIRLAAIPLGGRCVFASEWDADAARQYFANFGQAPFGDITREENKTYIPRGFDILCASLPLQAFALQHRRRPEERIRGTLFAEVADILGRRSPRAFMIECPAQQKDYARGTALGTMLDVLGGTLGYHVAEPSVLDTSDFGMAQRRGYLYIVGFDSSDDCSRFTYPAPTGSTSAFASVMEESPVSARYYISASATEGARARGTIIPGDGMATRRTTMVTDTRTTDILPSTHRLDRINREGIRRITPREHARLQGFPDDYRIKVPDSTAHRLLTSASPVLMAREVLRKMTECMGLEKFRYPGQR